MNINVNHPDRSWAEFHKLALVLYMHRQYNTECELQQKAV